ncbi:DUF4113 domain-containing protein [Aeromonas caviae]|nr:DUF4113 domain-containing protein [Aeromonas caviae]MDX7842855.1 DUF4113 domain-containing protein [Aeromonas caviae]
MRQEHLSPCYNSRWEDLCQWLGKWIQLCSCCLLDVVPQAQKHKGVAS